MKHIRLPLLFLGFVACLPSFVRSETPPLRVPITLMPVVPPDDKIKVGKGSCLLNTAVSIHDDHICGTTTLDGKRKGIETTIGTTKIQFVNGPFDFGSKQLSEFSLERANSEFTVFGARVLVGPNLIETGYVVIQPKPVAYQFVKITAGKASSVSGVFENAIVGYNDENGYYMPRYDGKEWLDVKYPTGTGTRCYAINDAWVVGEYTENELRYSFAVRKDRLDEAIKDPANGGLKAEDFMKLDAVEVDTGKKSSDAGDLTPGIPYGIAKIKGKDGKVDRNVAIKWNYSRNLKDKTPHAVLCDLDKPQGPRIVELQVKGDFMSYFTDMQHRKGATYRIVGTRWKPGTADDKLYEAVYADIDLKGLKE